MALKKFNVHVSYHTYIDVPIIADDKHLQPYRKDREGGCNKKIYGNTAARIYAPLRPLLFENCR